ncbi:serine hydrolase domain-containing protein [Balneola vulgaris]|uniref:serine hydrolase domain-containing protein n=1 Tax=Balneola vulgaris TaxID=287535 RepID=UPI0003658F70|nr:serine hydrolase [Balneola vulgaris]
MLLKRFSVIITTRLFLSTLLLVGFSCIRDLPVQQTYPAEQWEIVNDVSELGYSIEKLELAKSYANQINTAAVTIVVNGKILYEWGEVEQKYNTHSIRKSVLSALYGNYVADGTIDMEQTMEELGIDDVPPLSEEEKQATVRDNLKARSGIYHTALYESQGMKDLKPERFTQRPGTHWYYNNWDFNVAGTIFTQATGKGVFEAIEEEIAKPIGMEQFTAEDGNYVTGDASIHQAYPFRINARDLARFGLLMLRNGKWENQQLIPADWVKESTSYHSDATLYSSDGYGYMWWVVRDHNKYPHLPNVKLNEGAYSARGAGGHYVLIIPDYDMVLVHRVNTDIRNNRVSSSEFGTLVNLILDAKNQD